MASPSQEQLARLATLTRDYGRVPHQSSGLCSLWTGFCLMVLGTLSLQWALAAFHAAGSPSMGLVRFLVRTQPALPPWLLALAFCLPFLWAPVMRGLSRLAYPEPFGPVRGEASRWDLGFPPRLLRPLAQWGPLGTFTLMALFLEIILPLVWWALSLAPASPPSEPPNRWAFLLALLLGLGWAWLAPHLRRAEADEGTALVYMAGYMFLSTSKTPVLILLFLPVYLLIATGLIAYGIWAHLRLKRALAELAMIAEDDADA